MNNEPVAWMNEETLECGLCWQGIDWEDIGCIPLYTHLVKELTDEEIMSEWEKSKDEVDFARAILRKAQEKCNGFCGEYECKENQGICKRKAQENG